MPCEALAELVARVAASTPDQRLALVADDPARLTRAALRWTLAYHARAVAVGELEHLGLSARLGPVREAIVAALGRDPDLALVRAVVPLVDVVAGWWLMTPDQRRDAWEPAAAALGPAPVAARKVVAS